VEPAARLHSGSDWLQGIGIHLDRHMLIDQVEREHKAHACSLANQRAFDSEHPPGTDANPLSDHEFVKRLNALSAKVRAKKLEFDV
jgi:hypothetical protein